MDKFLIKKGGDAIKKEVPAKQKFASIFAKRPEKKKPVDAAMTDATTASKISPGTSGTKRVTAAVKETTKDLKPAAKRQKTEVLHCRVPF